MDKSPSLTSEKITCRFAALPKPFLGLYDIRPRESPVILLHTNLKDNHKLLRCVLAEELGHHFTKTGSVLAFARNTPYRYEKNEQPTIRWAVEYLLPQDKLVAVIDSGVFSTHELAEHFDVTEGFMGTALRIYCDKQFLLPCETI